MALTRAQLLAGNSSQGIVLAGQVQGVIQGPGISISPNGVITIDITDPTFNAFVKTNNPGAFNGLVWPGADGTPGQQLTTDGAGNLGWSDASGIPWTVKGQLLVGTGVGTDTLLNAGVNTSFLIANSTTASGLAYSNNVTSAALMPAGGTGLRPNPATAGQIRYNTDTQKFEFAIDPTTWEEIASADPTVGSFVSQTVPTTGSPSAVIPAGTTADQQSAPLPLAGYTRFNTDTLSLEVFDGAIWAPVGSLTEGLGIDITGSVVKLEIPIQFGPPAAGTLPAEAIDGSLYWDDNLGTMFIRYNDGTSTQWVQIMPTGGGGGGTYTGTLPIAVTGTVISLNLGLGVALNGNFLIAKTPELSAPPTIGTGATDAQLGSTYYDDTLGQLFVYYSNGGAPVWVAI